MKITRLLVLLFFVMSSFSTQAQQLRRAFILGENEEQYDQLRTEFARTLLTVCEESQEKAVTEWFQLLQAIEAYAEKIEFDLNGVKLFFNVFWEDNGSIAHFGILPMPDSKNVKHENLVAFFASFSRQYVPDGTLKSDKRFSHYTTVTFPTFSKRTNN